MLKIPPIHSPEGLLFFFLCFFKNKLLPTWSKHAEDASIVLLGLVVFWTPLIRFSQPPPWAANTLAACRRAQTATHANHKYHVTRREHIQQQWKSQEVEGLNVFFHWVCLCLLWSQVPGDHQHPGWEDLCSGSSQPGQEEVGPGCGIRVPGVFQPQQTRGKLQQEDTIINRNMHREHFHRNHIRLALFICLLASQPDQMEQLSTKQS